MSKVILINPFEVPKGKEKEEKEFLEMWDRAADFLKKQPGYISTRLHKCISPDSRFTFINIAEWESNQHFQEAVARKEFLDITAGSMESFPHFPGLYEVIRA